MKKKQHMTLPQSLKHTSQVYVVINEEKDKKSHVKKRNNKNKRQTNKQSHTQTHAVQFK